MKTEPAWTTKWECRKNTTVWFCNKNICNRATPHGKQILCTQYPCKAHALPCQCRSTSPKAPALPLGPPRSLHWLPCAVQHPFEDRMHHLVMWSYQEQNWVLRYLKKYLPAALGASSSMGSLLPMPSNLNPLLPICLGAGVRPSCVALHLNSSCFILQELKHMLCAGSTQLLSWL